MGTNPGVETRMGWDESDSKEFLKAIRQPLMVQTPLQLVIENLFNRLQSQATFIQMMKEKMDRIAVKDISAEELLERIKMLEAKQGDAAGPKLNPFNQQEILSRIEALESKVAEQGSQHHRGDEDVETRLARMEKRMTGVYNMPGKLAAVEQIANSLGIAVPDLEYPTGGAPPQQPHASAGPSPLAWRPPLQAQNSHASLLQPLPHPNNLTSLQPHSAHAQPATLEGTRRRSGPDAPPAPEGPGSAVLRPGNNGDDGTTNSTVWPSGFKGMARSGSPTAQVDLAAGLSTSPGRANSLTTQSPRAVGTPPSPPQFSGLGSPTSLQIAAAAAGGSSTIAPQKLMQLGQEVSAIRLESEAMQENLDTLSAQVAALRSGLGANAVESLSRLQHVEESVGALQAQVADLAAARRDAAARVGSEVTFADLSMLRSQVEASVAEAKVAASAAVTLAERELPPLAARVDELAEALRKKSEPRDIDALFHERINGLESSMGEMKAELLGSIEAAMESTVKLDDLQALEEVLDAKAPVDAVRLLQQQTSALGQALAGISEAMALRPDLGDALRGAAGPAGGPMAPVATKLRCLTCDQPIRQAALGGMNAGGVGTGGRNSFLPRLEAMPAKEGLPGGPGILVADLRASKEERLGTLRGVLMKAGDLEDYANGMGGLGTLRGSSPPRDVSPGRQVERSRASRVAVAGAAKPAPGPIVAKPVFI